MCTPRSLTKHGFWLCSAHIGSACPPLRSSAGRPHSFYTWMPAFPVSWGWKTPSTVSGAVSQLLCLGRRGRGCSRLLLISQTGSQAERGQVLPSAMAGSESPCLCVAWMRSMPDTAFIWGNQFFPPSSLLEYGRTTLLLGIVTTSSGQMGPGDTLRSGWGCDSAPCLGKGKLGSRDTKIPHLRIQIRQICIPC